MGDHGVYHVHVFFTNLKLVKKITPVFETVIYHLQCLCTKFWVNTPLIISVLTIGTNSHWKYHIGYEILEKSLWFVISICKIILQPLPCIDCFKTAYENYKYLVLFIYAIYYSNYNIT